jgi:hypothetical protein
MHWFLFLLLLVTASMILYQDFSSRSVLWYLFPLAGVLGLINSYLHTNSWQETVIYSTINAAFTLLQFALLKLYFSLKVKNNTKLINEKIGIGDLFFLLATGFFFSPLNFLLFYCSSLLFTMTVHLLLARIIKDTRSSQTVPLAGWIAVFLVVYIFFFCITNKGITNDDWILNYLL